MKSILKTGGILFLICFIATLGLAFTNEMTKGPIEIQRAEAAAKSRQEVLPSAETFEAVSEEELAKMQEKNAYIQSSYVGYDASGEVVGYAFTALPNTGFSGNIEIFTGIDSEGNITGVRMGTNGETPGLGSKASEPEFYGQYEGMSADAIIGVSKQPVADDAHDIQAITGATITSRAMTDGVNAAIDGYMTLSN